MKAASYPMARAILKGLLPIAASLLVAATPGRAAIAKSPVVDNRLSILPGSSATNQEPTEIFRQPIPLAKGMRSPDGIARDTETGDIYVANEDAATIVCIRPNSSPKTVFSATTPIYEETGSSRKRVDGLRSPEGLALDKDGTLYVVEDTPGGRLIAFKVKGPGAGSRSGGQVVPLPIENSRFAWEGIDVGPAGELLLAGSTMESMSGKAGQADFFKGAILYRDAKGTWWMPLNHLMTSYSAVCFSPDGRQAFFACEVPGTVGCLDLKSHFLRTFLSNQSFRSPEGLCALPGGAALVAEESGKIYWLDPTTDTVQLLYDSGSPVESLLWDGSQRRLLVANDQEGELVSLEMRLGLDFRSALGKPTAIPFKDQSTPVEMIPGKCPEYLAKVLELGGYDPDPEDGKLAFRDFARRYCLISIDAETRLVPNHKPVEDPIKHIQFVIVAPYLIGYQEGELIWSSSGFTVVKESGQIVKTELVKRQVVHGDLMESRFTPVGGQNIALPMPFSARINTDGFVSVNFMGMGVMADFYLVLDTSDPDKSVMVVIQPDGFVQQYEVRLPPRKDRSHWVVALERQGPDAWKKLSFKN